MLWWLHISPASPEISISISNHYSLSIMSEPTKESKPKPCCVCLDEKKARDECLLFNGQEGGKCQDMIEKYKACMKGYGFETR